MTRNRAVLLLVALLVGGLTLGGCSFSVYSLPLPGGANSGTDPLTVKAQFSDVLDLVPQSTVKLDDVTIGKVTGVQLKDGVAEVTMSLRRDAKLPSNVTAKIQQTSLLGEKFVELDPPTTGASPTPLKSGETIPLSRTGENPEVEQVLGALSLILNGGGVAQLKTIATELNKALAGREDSARSVLTQVDLLMKNLDDNKQSIVSAIESINRLSLSVHQQEKTIDATLEELPAALTSIDAQRKDLVTMLQALNRLGGTGVRVINASKESTISVVRNLQPVLSQLASAGDNFVNSLDMLTTGGVFPDATVGTTPQLARNLAMGDYVNLNVTMDLNLSALQNLPDVAQAACTTLKQVEQQLGGSMTLQQLLQLNTAKLCQSSTVKNLSKCQHDLEANLSHQPPITKLPASCAKVPTSVVGDLSKELKNAVANPPAAVCTLAPLLCKGTPSTGSGGSGGSSGGNPAPLCTLGLCRAAPGFAADERRPVTPVTLSQLGKALDPTLVSLMVPGLDTGGPVPAKGGPQ